MMKVIESTLMHNRLYVDTLFIFIDVFGKVFCTFVTINVRARRFMYRLGKAENITETRRRVKGVLSYCILHLYFTSFHMFITYNVTKGSG